VKWLVACLLKSACEAAANPSTSGSKNALCATQLSLSVHTVFCCTERAAQRGRPAGQADAPQPGALLWGVPGPAPCRHGVLQERQRVQDAAGSTSSCAAGQGKQGVCGTMTHIRLTKVVGQPLALHMVHSNYICLELDLGLEHMTWECNPPSLLLQILKAPYLPCCLPLRFLSTSTTCPGSVAWICCTTWRLA